ncbi:hypothetical protein ACQJBY_013858 [Aegilops geniculata]
MADVRARSMARGGGSLHRRLLSAGVRRLLPSGARRPLPSSMARDGHYRGAPPSGVGHPTPVPLCLSLSPGTSKHGQASGAGERGFPVAR